MNTLIVIPARHGSTRFPGKPLAKISGKIMLDRVVSAATKAAELIGTNNTSIVVATDDDRIADHCTSAEFPFVMTDPSLPSGTDRAHAAMQTFSPSADIIVNLQGDAPFTPAEHISTIAKAAAEPGYDAATPFVQLSWEALDQLREHKQATPFSGTTLTCTKSGNALWFSKQIIPAIRREDSLRKLSSTSPVRRHVGLYGFKRDSLEKYVSLGGARYEKLEGLEQLRMLENGMRILCVQVQPPQIAIPGIDTPEDVALAEKLISIHGDPAV